MLPYDEPPSADPQAEVVWEGVAARLLPIPICTPPQLPEQYDIGSGAICMAFGAVTTRHERWLFAVFDVFRVPFVARRALPTNVAGRPLCAALVTQCRDDRLYGELFAELSGLPAH